MTDVMEPGGLITLADFTLIGEDAPGDDIARFIVDEEPDHDPFADYEGGKPVDPDEGDEPRYAAALFGIPMGVSAKLAHNLAVRRQRIWDCYGSKVVIGWIGDSSHQQECSDHNMAADGTVHAIDPMLTGSRAQAVVNECLAHHDDLQYVIHNRTIWSASYGWKARKYTGSPHDDHVHISGKHGSSNKNGATCTGYDKAAEAKTPVFNPCATPKPPAPTPKPPVVKVGDPGTRVLQYVKGKPLMTGNDVRFVQTFIGAGRTGGIDGKFGPQTAAAVRWYRSMRGLKVVGVVDAATWKQMGVQWRG